MEYIIYFYNNNIITNINFSNLFIYGLFAVRGGGGSLKLLIIEHRIVSIDS